MKTLHEVAKLFGVHYNTVAKWVKSGTLKAVHIGSVIRVTDEEIERLKNGEKAGADNE